MWRSRSNSRWSKTRSPRLTLAIHVTDRNCCFECEAGSGVLQGLTCPEGFTAKEPVLD
jgi:hypothetical protein